MPPLSQARRRLWGRRAVLLRLAGGSLAALFGLPARAEGIALDDAHLWRVLEAVQGELLPSEPAAPGAREINAMGYLRGVVSDPLLPAEDRSFILQGVSWLEDLARDQHGVSFLALDAGGRDGVLRRVAASRAGENWLATLILYVLEALLSDPVYGGNPAGIGWRWLEHTPGFPRPPPDKTYPRLIS